MGIEIRSVKCFLSRGDSEALFAIGSIQNCRRAVWKTSPPCFQDIDRNSSIWQWGLDIAIAWSDWLSQMRPGFVQMPTVAELHYWSRMPDSWRTTGGHGISEDALGSDLLLECDKRFKNSAWSLEAKGFRWQFGVGEIRPQCNRTRLAAYLNHGVTSTVSTEYIWPKYTR